MPAFVVAFQNKDDRSVLQVHVAAGSAAEAVRLLQEKYPSSAYTFVFITPDRDDETTKPGVDR